MEIYLPSICSILNSIIIRLSNGCLRLTVLHKPQILKNSPLVISPGSPSTFHIPESISRQTPYLKMHVLILGGSGRTGKVIVNEALSRGCTITALVRNPASLSEFQSPLLEVIRGSPQNESDIRTSFLSHNPDTVIVALSSNEEGFMAGVHRILVELIKEAGREEKTKVVTMQAFGTGSSNKNVWWPMRLALNYSPMAKGQADHNMVEEVMQGSGLKWTLPRPVMLSESEKKSVRDCGDAGDAKGMGLMPSVSRKSVAAFLLDVAADRSGKWLGRTPVISD